MTAYGAVGVMPVPAQTMLPVSGMITQQRPLTMGAVQVMPRPTQTMLAVDSFLLSGTKRTAVKGRLYPPLVDQRVV